MRDKVEAQRHGCGGTRSPHQVRVVDAQSAGARGGRHLRQSKHPLEERTDPGRVEPAHLLKGGPELRCLVDINLAGLLRVGLAKLFAGAQTLQATLKDASLARQVRRAVEAQVSCEKQLVGVEQTRVGIATEVDRLPLPVYLEAIGPVGQGGEGRTVIRYGAKVLVLPVRSHDPPRRFWGGAGAARGLCGIRDDARDNCRATGAHRARGGVRLCHSIHALPRYFGGNGPGGQDGLVPLSPRTSVRYQKGPLLTQPALAVGREVLHDLRPKRQDQLVVLSSGRRNDTTKDML